MHTPTIHIYTEARKRLYLASEDMLAALKFAAEHLQHIVEETPTDKLPPYHCNADALDLALTAIAKAENEEKA